MTDLSCPNEIRVRLNGDVVLLQNYEKLMNLPKIGGITLIGNLTATELSLLSALANEYQTVSASDVKDTHYVPVMGEGESKKILLSALRGTKVMLASEIPADMDVGDFIFLQKGE